MKTMVAAICSMLFGCGNTTHVPPTHQAALCSQSPNAMISSDGVCFQNDPNLIVLDQTSFDTMIVQPYRETEQCTGITAPGPSVFPADMPEPVPAGIGRGLMYPDDGRILLSPMAITDPYFYTGNPEIGRIPGTSVTRHEFVHYLLWTTNFPPDDNHNHNSPLFKKCANL